MAIYTTRVTAGVLVEAGCHNLGAKEVIEVKQRKKQKKNRDKE